MAPNQGSVNDASGGGLVGNHPATTSSQFLVGTTTEDQVNLLRFPLIAIGCWGVDDVRFAFDSSFVDADCSGGGLKPEDIRIELDLLKALLAGNPGCPLSIFGHADPVGDDVYNKSLSERRAKAIYALLIFKSQPDTAVSYWQAISQTERWGTNQQQKMQALTGKTTTGKDLMHSYLDMLSTSGPTLTKTDFLGQGQGTDRKGDFQGCSEFNPRLIFSQEKLAQFDKAKSNNDAAGIADRNAQNAPNRRVLGLLFKKGSKVEPSSWPCPRASEGIAGCVRRFWADGETRRSTHLPNNVDRNFDDKQDTFACRFYQRLAGWSPCEFPPASGNPIWIGTVPIYGTDGVKLVIRDSSGKDVTNEQVDVGDSGPDDSREFDLSKLDPEAQHTIEYLHGDQFLVPKMALCIGALRRAMAIGSVDEVKKNLFPAGPSAPPAKELEGDGDANLEPFAPGMD